MTVTRERRGVPCTGDPCDRRGGAAPGRDRGDAGRGHLCNERWLLTALDMRLPVAMILKPRGHHDLADLPDELASEMGLLTVAIAAGIEGLPRVGRCHVGSYGDGRRLLEKFRGDGPAWEE